MYALRFFDMVILNLLEYMIHDVVKVICSELSLPLLVLQEDHVDLGLLSLGEEAIFLLPVLAEVHF